MVLQKVVLCCEKHVLGGSWVEYGAGFEGIEIGGGQRGSGLDDGREEGVGMVWEAQRADDGFDRYVGL
jgi:hypothetical protein